LRLQCCGRLIVKGLDSSHRGPRSVPRSGGPPEPVRSGCRRAHVIPVDATRPQNVTGSRARGQTEQRFPAPLPPLAAIPPAACPAAPRGQGVSSVSSSWCLLPPSRVRLPSSLWIRLGRVAGVGRSG
jgi:hypothetical protein